MRDKRWLWMGASILLLAGIFACSCYGNRIQEKGGYAIVMKSTNNWYNELASQGYRQVIEEEGKACITLYPENSSAQDQIRLIRNLIHDQVAAIAVAANDEHALAPVLKEAMEKGISVVTLDADTEAGSRSIYIKPVDAQILGRELVRSVHETCGGSGQWVILSAGSRSANQNEWIRWMKKELEEPRYRNLRLVDIAFGEGVYDKAAEETKRLMNAYPDMKVICCLSTEGMKAAADVIKEMDMQRDVKIVGLGLPGQMAEYIGSGEEDICPVMYIWNPVDMGELAAYISIELSEQRIEERDNQTITLKNGNTYKLEYGRGGGLEIISGEPIRIDMENIGYWKSRL